ncbi:hypothetical protein CRV03_07200 [Arcobacter sp. F155]|uniref:helicase HerA domain-containing protein n=1 Tax=Arcobacter sp. F155 TaxID=2044512 RepID=UPI00100ADC09|nr:DUF87 domain-containing protein [Arcobacter sp. F155]RXJ77042.1 hypothetical protein CRV03_07200 [Arcobacter sp. F155]
MQILEIIEQSTPLGVIGSPSDSFEAVVDILGISSEQKLLGELVFFTVPEGENTIVSIGQITDIRTENKWHEEPSFKAVIKRHGSLPHLSGNADNRIAKLTVQSSFKISEEINAHKLANSPSTGNKVCAVTNDIMVQLLKTSTQNQIVEYLGCAYDTEVRIPFWFKHFGKDTGGAGDAYHIGVFGKTGSGKTTTAAQVLKGYATNKNHMSILVLDPQEQFYTDTELLPDNMSFKDEVIKKGMKYKAIKVPEDVHFPDDPEVFSELLRTSGFIRKFFNITTEEKQIAMCESISEYIETRILYTKKGSFLGTVNAKKLLEDILTRFLEHKTETEKKQKCSRYFASVYAPGAQRNIRIDLMTDKLDALKKEKALKEVSILENILALFSSSSNKISLDDMVHRVVKEKGWLYIINLSTRGTHNIGSDNIQALLIKLITKKVVEASEELYSAGDKSNCLIVMDEAHRYTNSTASDPRIKELNKNIIDAVRTTRKYGIGYMFITQTIESLDEEIIQQMRIFAFGYGLTMGKEFGKIKQIINDDNAAKFYKSFIDPSSNKKYPFMFHGPISPLSFTGSPLFLEMK